MLFLNFASQMKADHDWFLSKNPVGHLCRGGGVYGDVVVYAVWAGHGSVRDVHYPAGVDYFRGAAFAALYAVAAEAPLGADGSGNAGKHSGAMGRLDGHQPAASAKPAPGAAAFLRGTMDFPFAGSAAV